MSAFFDHVRQRSVALSSGACDLPILYRGASQFGVFFPIELAKARALLSDTTLEPWPMLGTAVGAVYVWEYRDTTIGAYNEVGLGVQARRRGSRPSLLRLGWDMLAQEDQGIWVVSLPVSTEAARGAGVEIWGYPKYVTSIETRFCGDAARVRLGDELELSIGRLHGPLKALPIVTYTARAGRLLRTAIKTECPVRWGTGLSAQLTLTGGDGPTARAIRALGLDTRRPLAAFRTDSFHAILPAGVDLGPAGVAGPTI